MVAFAAANQINVAQTLTVKAIPAKDQTVQVIDTVDAEGNRLTEGTTITVNTVKIILSNTRYRSPSIKLEIGSGSPIEKLCGE